MPDVYFPQPIRGKCDFESLHYLVAKIHAHQTSGESSVFAQEAVNGPGHLLRLAALRADDDACVIRGDPVQADEVPPIVGEQDSLFSRGEGQHGVVGGSFVSETAMDDPIEIVAESCQRAADFGVEVFVRENRAIAQADALSAMARSISSRCAA